MGLETETKHLETVSLPHLLPNKDPLISPASCEQYSITLKSFLKDDCCNKFRRQMNTELFNQKDQKFPKENCHCITVPPLPFLLRQ